MPKSVFEQLGLPNHKELELKSELASEIRHTIEKRNLTQRDAAKIAGIAQAKVSCISRADLNGFSAEKLLTILTALGRDVTITVGKRVNKSRPGQLTMSAS